MIETNNSSMYGRSSFPINRALHCFYRLKVEHGIDHVITYSKIEVIDLSEFSDLAANKCPHKARGQNDHVLHSGDVENSDEDTSVTMVEKG